MAYNSTNLNSGVLAGAFNNNFNIRSDLTYSGSYLWAYSTADTLSTVFSTGFPYFTGESKFRVGDMIEITAGDGKAVAIVNNASPGGNPTVVSCNAALEF